MFVNMLLYNICLFQDVLPLRADRIIFVFFVRWKWVYNCIKLIRKIICLISKVSILLTIQMQLVSNEWLWQACRCQVTTIQVRWADHVDVRGWYFRWHVGHARTHASKRFESFSWSSRQRPRLSWTYPLHCPTLIICFSARFSFSAAHLIISAVSVNQSHCN